MEVLSLGRSLEVKKQSAIKLTTFKLYLNVYNEDKIYRSKEGKYNININVRGN